MKTIIFTIMALALVVSNGYANPSNELIDALCQVESNNKPLVIGDRGLAYGILQIHQTVVEDVNRISNSNYSHRDCFNPEYARDICMVYLTHYGKVYQTKTGKAPTDEIYARIWNGGPNGWNPKYKAKYSNTTKYWNKVKKELTKVE